MKEFLKLFEVPEAARPIIDRIVEGEEIALVEEFGNRSFSLDEAFVARGRWSRKARSLVQVDVFLRRAYKRAVLSLEAESFARYKASNFYGRLDVFAVTESEAYGELPSETRKALDDWYFGAYISKLGDAIRPTEDRIVGLEEAYAIVEREDRPIWLNGCDCRILAGNCDMPTETCISFRSGINTMAHRGWSRQIGRDEAKRVLAEANAAGLMQTVNPNGMCNCCGDCCYLFRARASRASGAAWPAAPSIAVFSEERCVGCGACAERCHFGAFAVEAGRTVFKPELCVGCGLCVSTCGAGAISLRGRE